MILVYLTTVVIDNTVAAGEIICYYCSVNLPLYNICINHINIFERLNWQHTPKIIVNFWTSQQYISQYAHDKTAISKQGMFNNILVKKRLDLNNYKLVESYTYDVQSHQIIFSRIFYLEKSTVNFYIVELLLHKRKSNWLDRNQEEQFCGDFYLLAINNNNNNSNNIEYRTFIKIPAHRQPSG